MLQVLMQTSDGKDYECYIAEALMETWDEIHGSYNANAYWRKRNSYKLVHYYGTPYIVPAAEANNLELKISYHEVFYNFTGFDWPHCGYGVYLYGIGWFADMRHVVQFILRSCGRKIIFITDGDREYTIDEVMKLGRRWNVWDAVVYSKTALGEYGSTYAAENLARVFRASVDHYLTLTMHTSNRNQEIKDAAAFLSLNTMPAWHDPLPDNIQSWLEEHRDLVYYVVFQLHNE